MCPWRRIRWYDNVILSFLVSNIYFNCIVQDYDMGTIWHCALVSCTPSQSISPLFWGGGGVCFVVVVLGDLFVCMFVCCLFVCFVCLFVCFCLFFWGDCSGVECHYVFLLLIYLSFLWLCSSGSATTHIPGCICPWTFYLKIGLNILPSDSFMSYINSLLGYNTADFQALQLIVLAVFGAVD